MISVIIPTYNHAQYVCEAIDSVLAQTYTDYEIIVVNDGSPDNTPDMLRPYVESNQIHYIEQRNQGQAGARNRGLQESRGEFIAYLDDDDWWFPDKLEWQHELMQKHPDVVLVWGGIFYPGHDSPSNKKSLQKVIVSDVYRAFLYANRIHSPGQTLIRRSALEKAGGFDPEIWGSDDWDLYIRLAKLGPFAQGPQHCLNYRLHEDNASRSAVRHSHNHFKVMAKHMGLNLPLMMRHLKMASAYFVPNLLRASRAARTEHAYGMALAAQLHALVYRPSLLFKRTFLLPLGGNLLRLKPRRRT